MNKHVFFSCLFSHMPVAVFLLYHMKGRCSLSHIAIPYPTLCSGQSYSLMTASLSLSWSVCSQTASYLQHTLTHTPGQCSFSYCFLPHSFTHLVSMLFLTQPLFFKFLLSPLLLLLLILSYFFSPFYLNNLLSSPEHIHFYKL